MTTKVQRWGNSLAVRLPKEVADKLNLGAGSSVSISLNSKNILIKPTLKKDFSLGDLLGQITSENTHKEISYGKLFGKEIW